jgi:hypothetical protein
LHLAGRGEIIEGTLHGALACAKRQRERRARPGFAVGKEGKHCRMLLLDGPRQNDDPAPTPRHQRKSSLCCAHVRDGLQRPSKPPDLDPQPRAV